MSKRRDNRLTPDEINIAISPLELETLSFDGAVKLFIADAKRRALRDDTIEYYQRQLGMFRRYLVQIDKTALISEVSRSDIDNFVDYEKRRGMQNTTINVRLRALRAFFHFLYEMKYIKVNPMEKYPLLKIRANYVETFTVKQLQQLLNAPDRRTFTGLRDYTFMLLLLDTGLRLSEAAAIEVKDVKLAEGLLFVRHTKGHMHRYVPLSAKMRAQLQRYIKIRGHAETDRLFVTLDGEPMSRYSLQKIVGKYGKQAGIKGVRCSPHTLRHTFAKLAVMNGAGIFELQKILGHTTMEMVKTYVNLFSTDIQGKHEDFSPLKDL